MKKNVKKTVRTTAMKIVRVGLKLVEAKKADTNGHIDQPTLICTNCNHERHRHYGSEKHWCNLSGCTCLEWKQ